MFVSRRKYNKLVRKYSYLIDCNSNIKLENTECNIILSILRSRNSMLSLIENSKKHYTLQEDIDKLEILKKIVVYDLCASNYVTKTKSGELIVDVQQIPRTTKEIESLLKEMIK